MSNLISEIMKISDEDELRDLNDLIVSRLRDMYSIRQMQAKSQFKIGDEVNFFSNKVGLLSGRVVKKNPKTIVVSTPNGEWRVSPSMLNKVER